MRRSPYKFLASYEPEDADRFFGRDVETDVLLADVVINRLVVLFAKTGTGKTSLINAGVRPRLKERGYDTYTVRTRADPVESARTTLTAEAGARFPPTGSFAEQLRGLSLKRPIVIFFDQFEEFFLYLVSQDVDRAESFVADVAELYEDPDSGVHLVFSMREEWFVDMSFFADRIPEIFHNDANLRLRWFDVDQARAAIVGPVGADAFAPELIERLLVELVETGRAVAGKPSPGAIEPAQLQIVCDTLWRARDGEVLQLADYEALGAPGRAESVARQILDRRLIEEFGGFESRQELELLTRLLPELETEERTKRVRDYADLVSSMQAAPVGADPTLIRRVLERLKEAGLLDIVPREAGELVELTHDYLVLRLDELLEAIGLIWPQRALAEGVRARRSDGTLLASAVLPELLADADRMAMDAEAGELLLRSALGHLSDFAPVIAAVERSGAPAWQIIDERVRQGTEGEQLRAIECLTQNPADEAVAVLARALDYETVALHVVRAVARVPQAHVVDLLEQALARPHLAGEARAALALVADSPADPGVAERARSVLRRALDLLSPREAAGALAEMEARSAAELLDERSDPDARSALIRLATDARYSPARTVAQRLVLDRVELMLDAGKAEAWVADTLADLQDERSARLLGQLAALPEHSSTAESALQSLTDSDDPVVAAAAAKQLDRLVRDPQLAAHEPPPAPPVPLPPPRASATPESSALDAHFAAVLQLLANGRLVPLLGAGSAMVGRHPGEDWTPGQTPPSGAELASYLADRYRYPEFEQRDLLRVTQYIDTMVGRAPLVDELHHVLAMQASAPTPLDRLLAELRHRFRPQGRASLPLILSVRYDDLLERAFKELDEPFAVMTYIDHGHDAGRFRCTTSRGYSFVVDPTRNTELGPEDGALIVKLFGGVDIAEPDNDSYVITEDDYLEYIAHAAQTPFLPPEVEDALRRSSYLFLGYSLRDWNVRLLLQSLDRGRPGALRRRSWAVTLRPSEVDVALWRRRDVDIIEMPLDDYSRLLEQQVSHFDLTNLPA
jgi:conflict system STAND superfamily ATPase/SIR2-like protein